MEQFRLRKIHATEAARELSLSRSQFYRLWSQYLRAVGLGSQQHWEPICSGGDRRSQWTKEMEELARSLLSSRPVCSYSLIASEIHRRLGTPIDRATVRRWAQGEGLAPDTSYKSKPKIHRRWQVEQIGQLWQYDVSPHRWLPEQDVLFPLFNILDDRSRLIAGTRIYPRESLLWHLDFLSRVFLQNGLPLALYVDYHSFFFGKYPDRLTQLGSALRFYQVSLRYAPTPQAKGKIERSHQYWQNRLPALFAAEKIQTLHGANHLIDPLRIHHNQNEVHSELQMTPMQAWQQCLSENKSALRSTPTCPWWHYVFSLRSSVRVDPQGRIPIGNMRYSVDCSPGVRLTRCIHPCGKVSVLLEPPNHQKLPMVVLEIKSPQPNQGNF